MRESPDRLTFRVCRFFEGQAEGRFAIVVLLALALVTIFAGVVTVLMTA